MLTPDSVVLVFSGDNGTNVILYDNEQHATDRLRTLVKQWLVEDGYDLTVDDFAFDTWEDLTEICITEWSIDVVMTTLGKPGDE